ncbi:MAG TPA: hypothetical protein ENG59_03055 [Chloroflexi bacterium]|nr:MAG: hypothetical protein DRI46_06180 [Chloroflexota bacterium]HDD55204.1 hypothetical protein [Chloroflexota bacterium]
MDERITFYPSKRTGTIVHIALMLIFSAAGIWGIWGVSTVQMAPQLLPYLALIGLFLVTVPYLIYHLYALHHSAYILERGGITLQWGWRSVTLPVDQVKWVYRDIDLEIPPRPPALHWPGSVTGVRKFQRGPEVEFLASRVKRLVIISASDRYYAISPLFVDEFISTYLDFVELGALQPLPEESIQPTLVLSEISRNRLTLGIILAGGLLNISLLIWTLLVIPTRESISLGFRPDGLPRLALESVRLILFPILSSSAFLANLVLGLFMFRNPENRALAYILWAAGILTALLFLIGLSLIL